MQVKNIINFVRLDFYTLRKNWLPLLTFPPVWIGFSLLMRDISWLNTGMFAELVAVMIHPFMSGENNNLDTLYATLPMTRRDIVRGRYLFTIISEIVALALILALAQLLRFVMALEDSPEMLLVLARNILIFSALASVQLPFLFNTSYSEAKASFFLSIGAIGLVLILLRSIAVSPNGSLLAAFFSSHTGLTCLMAIASTLTMLGISYKFSCVFYERRDL